MVIRLSQSEATQILVDAIILKGYTVKKIDCHIYLPDETGKSTVEYEFTVIAN